MPLETTPPLAGHLVAPSRRRLLVALLSLVITTLASSGCHTLVLGPGNADARSGSASGSGTDNKSSGASADAGGLGTAEALVLAGPSEADSGDNAGPTATWLLFGVPLAFFGGPGAVPPELAYGPETGPSIASTRVVATALDIVAKRLDLADLAERKAFVVGLRKGAPLLHHRPEARYLASAVAEKILANHGEIALDEKSADIVVIPWIHYTGEISSYREYRQYGYPVYTHEETQGPASVLVLLYDKKTRRLEALEGEKVWQVRIDSFLLGIFPVRWVIGL